MSDISEALENWDGTSAPPDEVAQHIKGLTDKPSEDKINTYIGAFDDSAGADDPRADHHKPTGDQNPQDSC
jgi:hypothetical protein